MPHSGGGERAMAHNNATHEEAGCARDQVQPVQEPISTEQWRRRYLRQLDLLEAETRHLPSVSRQSRANPDCRPTRQLPDLGAERRQIVKLSAQPRARMVVALS
jgi:hypothetical protein